jgi:hypothetical protein
MNTKNYQIIISDYKIDVVRKNIKNLHLAVYPPNGRIRIATPIRLTDDAIRLFAVSKLPWIKKQIRKFDHQERQTEREFVSRESHYYQGTRYLLNVIESNSTPKVELRSKTFIDLFVRPNSSRAAKEKILNEWYRKQLKEDIPSLIEKWQKIIGVEVNDWGIKLMKTRWGSCNPRVKRIWINLECAKKPFHCLEYIIVHEIVHLLERKHNEKFINYMNKFLPQWRIYKEELNRFPLNHENWSY